MLNFAVNPELLAPFVPRGTELDFYRAQTYLSVVGFQFLHTRVFGIPFPFHKNFEEVNLRFYVRRKVDGEWRRGVVFIRELVPRRAIAFIARTFYGEPYLALPMRHSLDHSASGINLSYSWRRNGRWETLRGAGAGDSQELPTNSKEEFITEHYWGYTARPGGCHEYQVEHPRWRLWRCTEASLDADIVSLYGQPFVQTLSTPPASAFIADGSSVSVKTAKILS
jgi:uncharacterized protein YqjF (DUF2071 family)